MEDFRQIVENLSPKASEGQMFALVEYVRTHSISDADVAFLATKLADSGTVLPPIGDNGVDVASTGGPSSLSTLLVPLYLRALGRIVPKLAVPGRPAGGVDVLATIPGYRVDLQPSEVTQCLQACGYAHFLSNGRYAPLDARLFAYRQTVGAQHSVPLVIASLLAKKLAVGLRQIGLDIRVGPHGNFGSSFDEARENAHRFCSVARSLGLKAVCILSDATYPYQPWIGRGEALVALSKLFSGNQCPGLNSHSGQCWRMALYVTSANDTIPPTGSQLRQIFADNLASQGSDIERYDKRVKEILEYPKLQLRAKASGHVVVRLDILRSVLVETQRCEAQNGVCFPDPAGVQLLTTPGQFVGANVPLAAVRAREEFQGKLKNELAQAIFVGEDSLGRTSAARLAEEVVSDE